MTAVNHPAPYHWATALRHLEEALATGASGHGEFERLARAATALVDEARVALDQQPCEFATDDQGVCGHWRCEHVDSVCVSCDALEMPHAEIAQHEWRSEPGAHAT
jgi:hypothetical protein